MIKVLLVGAVLATSLFAAEMEVVMTNTYKIDDNTRCINGRVWKDKMVTNNRCEYKEKRKVTNLHYPPSLLSEDEKVEAAYKSLRYKIFGKQLRHGKYLIGLKGWGVSFSCEEIDDELIRAYGYEKTFYDTRSMNFCANFKKGQGKYPIITEFRKSGEEIKYFGVRETVFAK